MQPDIRVWLFDVLEAIANVEEYMAGIPAGFKSYKENKMLKQAVDRKLEIIGEAVNRVRKSGQGVEVTNAKQIIDLRNRIIHSYDAIQDDIIYSIVIRQLPLLKAN